jgi:SAM-dependent methyltransferase
MEPPWEHPDWYDLHDTAWTAGSEREPEHYRELVLALPPLGEDTHLVDIGAGTGKLSHLIARGYPEIGHVTLVEPSEVKLRRARARLTEALPRARVDALAVPAGRGQLAPSRNADIVVFGSVLMPPLEHGALSFAEGLAWVDRALSEAAALLRPGGWLHTLETLGNAFVRPTTDGPARRLLLLELIERLGMAGLADVECVYRFRDRVTVRGRAR